MPAMMRWTEEQLAEHEAKRAGQRQARPVSSVFPAKPVASSVFPPAALAPASPKEGLFALGHLQPGEMNKTEAKYAAHLGAEMLAGRVLWWKFEGIKLRLANMTFFTVDFAVMGADGRLEMVDVKGAKAIVEEDARVKVKVAASIYPFVFKLVFPRKGGGWDIEEVRA